MKRSNISLRLAALLFLPWLGCHSGNITVVKTLSRIPVPEVADLGMKTEISKTEATQLSGSEIAEAVNHRKFSMKDLMENLRSLKYLSNDEKLQKKIKLEDGHFTHDIELEMVIKAADIFSQVKEPHFFHSLLELLNIAHIETSPELRNWDQLFDLLLKLDQPPSTEPDLLGSYRDSFLIRLAISYNLAQVNSETQFTVNEHVVRYFQFRIKDRIEKWVHPQEHVQQKSKELVSEYAGLLLLAKLDDRSGEKWVNQLLMVPSHLAYPTHFGSKDYSAASLAAVQKIVATYLGIWLKTPRIGPLFSDLEAEKWETIATEALHQASGF